mgnify:CR=1 FL=1
MGKLRVALIFGGKSGEHEVSITSAMSVYKALDKSKYDITLVGIDKNGRWVTPDAADIQANLDTPRKIDLGKSREAFHFDPAPGANSKFDVFVPILHGTYGEDGTIQGLFDLAQVAYVGSGVIGSAVGMDKELAKRVLEHAGLPVVPYITVRRYEFDREPRKFLDEAEKRFGFPYFVKPANMGSSVGVHKVKNVADAAGLLKDAFKYDTKVLIERGVNARELEISVLGNNEPKASVVGEVVPNHEFYSYEAKYIDAKGADLFIPARNLSEGQVAQIQKLAVQCFSALECAGMARVDFFLDKNSGEFFINEINTIPGFTSISMYPKMWEASGLPYPRLLDRLIELALERHRERAALKTTYEVKS